MYAYVFAALLVGQAGEFEGTVISVHDGDTARVQKADGMVVNVRFLICDAPEIEQPHGVEAREFMKTMCLNNQVTVRTEGQDEHGRTLGEISVDGESVNKALIENGHAWWFYHYDDEEEHGQLEVEARAAKRGLWAASNPIYPRNWRAGARIRRGDALPAPVFVMALMPDPFGVDDNNETSSWPTVRSPRSAWTNGSLPMMRTAPSRFRAQCRRAARSRSGSTRH